MYQYPKLFHSAGVLLSDLRLHWLRIFGKPHPLQRRPSYTSCKFWNTGSGQLFSQPLTCKFFLTSGDHLHAMVLRVEG
jgi:hypothetical protein